jgi:hypothetical protein
MFIGQDPTTERSRHRLFLVRNQQVGGSSTRRLNISNKIALFRLLFSTFTKLGNQSTMFGDGRMDG